VDWLVWLIVGVVLLGVEAVTLAFVAVYFGVAALAAALIAGIGGPLWLQVVVFCVVSLAGLGLTRRIATRILRGPVVKTNIHRLVGQRGIVTKAIPADVGQGQIQIGTEFWTARPYFDDGSTIPVGAKVEVMKVDGVTAVVLEV
jgi:membrane protein implicated in regulation of membrane protease activity